MFSFYKWKKNALFILTGIIPLIIFLMIFFPTIKYYDFEGIKIMYIDIINVLIALIAAFVAIIILMIVGNRWLRHAFTNMLEGKGLLSFILDSTGVIGSFNVKVDTPKMQGIYLPKNAPIVEDIYDSDLLHRLLIPKDATMTKATTFETDPNGKLIFGEQRDVLVLPKQDDGYKNLFSFENRPVLIFNKVMNKFLSREALSSYEKDIEIKHNALNILRKVQETDTSFRNFGRYIGENIKPMRKGFFASPIIKYIIIAAVIGLIVFVILLFVPGLLQAGSNLQFP